MVTFSRQEWLPCRIRHVVEERGFSFGILPDGRSVFIHVGSLRGGLVFGPGLQGSVVKVLCTEGEKGLRATDAEPGDTEQFAIMVDESGVTGTVTSIIESRTFGFIRRDDGQDVFFHKDDLTGGLEFDARLQEMPVTFNVVAGAKGPRAVNVRPKAGAK